MNILILHGWGQNSALWTEFCKKLYEHKTVAFDLPGFGNEPLASTEWGIPNYADWVIEKIKKQKERNIILIGHSFGGKIATEIAIKCPELVKKLILIAAPVIRKPNAGIRIKIALLKIAKKILFNKSCNILLSSEYKEAKKSGLDKVFKNSVEYDRTDEISKIKAPVLIVWGKNDETAPIAIGKRMHSLIKNSKLEIVSGGHNLHLENPYILFGVIKRFIAKA